DDPRHREGAEPHFDRSDEERHSGLRRASPRRTGSMCFHVHTGAGMKTFATLGFILAAAALALAAAADSLGDAKELYASAAYEEALAALTRVDENSPPETVKEAREYRAFCLFALGRTEEAEKVAEALIQTDPLLRLADRDRSPRIEAMFTGVR